MKRGLLIFLAGCILIVPALVMAEEWSDPIAAYIPVFIRYAAGMAGNEDILMEDDSVATAHRCGLYTENGPFAGTGYYFSDLDGDGTPELIIGLTGEMPVEENFAIEILTLREGVPVTVHRGWERYRVYLTYDETAGRYGYYAEGSSGASNSIYEYGLVSAGMGPWEDAHTLETNLDSSEETLRWTLDGQEITAQQAEELIVSWQEKRIGLPYKSFADQML